MKFIPVYNFINYIDAHIMAGRLEEEGIRCELADEHSVTINPVFTNAIGGIKLMVAEVQAERAIELIQKMKAAENNIICPNCASDKLQPLKQITAGSFWLSHFRGLFTGMVNTTDNQYCCSDCGYEITVKKPVD